MIEITRRILQVIFSALLAVSLGLILKNLVLDPYFSGKENDEVREIYHSSSETAGAAGPKEDKFSELLAIDPDICGWISAPGTRIDYPVLQAGEDSPDFYLTHNYKKEKSKYGSIFAAANSKVRSNPKNIVLYGHHMNDGQMFADLMKFSDADFCSQNPTIDFRSAWEENGNWKIISVFKTNTLAKHGAVFDYGVSKFSGSESFMQYVEDVKKRSLIETGVDVRGNDRLLTLSTCSYELEGFRTVLVARKVRQGESEFVDASLIKAADNPLMPNGWYEKYGGFPPT